MWLALGALCCLAMVIPARIFADSLPNASHLFVGEARQHVGRRLLEAGAAWWALYAVGIAALLRAPRRLGAAVGVLTSAGIGFASIARATTTSNDSYRYAWDGLVQAAGIDPYRYAPAASQLDRLHTAWLWPNAATCAIHRQPPGCTLINRATVHTIYPPLAQLWFLIEHYAIPQSTRDRGYETGGLLIVTATSFLLLAFLHQTRRDIRYVAIWGCCPAVAIEAVQNAHIDGLAVAFVVLAVWMAERQSWTAAAAAIGAAGLIKLYPLVLFPAVIQQRRIRSAIIIAAMFVAGYLPHVLAVGGGVTGFLGTYIHQEGYLGGRRYQLLHLVGLTGPAASAVAIAAVSISIALAFRKRLGPPAQAALTVFAVVLFVANPGEPWEDLSLVALAAMTGVVRWLTIVAIEEASYITFIFGGFRTWTGPRGDGIALGVSIAAWVGHRSQRRARSVRTTPIGCAPLSCREEESEVSRSPEGGSALDVARWCRRRTRSCGSKPDESDTRADRP